MSEINRHAFGDQRFWISVWFILDAIVALTPPLHWSVDDTITPIFGIPVPVLYFVAVGACICASIIAAYRSEAVSRSLER